jgi:hypothetical protein
MSRRLWMLEQDDLDGRDVDREREAVEQTAGRYPMRSELEAASSRCDGRAASRLGRGRRRRR